MVVGEAEMACAYSLRERPMSRAWEYWVTRLTKAGINQLPNSLDAALQWDALAQPLTMATEDIHEGIRAVHERRAPSFKGR